MTSVSVQSAGKPPTNWGMSSSNGTAWDNITATIVGIGTANGISYIDVKCAGTSSSAAQNCAVKEEATNGIAATNAQTWDHSVYVALVGGSTANVTNFGVGVDQYDSTPAYLSGTTTTNHAYTVKADTH